MSKVSSETSAPPVAGRAVCCIIAPVDNPGTAVRQRADAVYENIFSPAAERCGLSAWRADLSAFPGRIPDEVLRHLYDDPIVVADLTGNNGSVAYELAIRGFYGKPTVAVIDEEEKSIPFYQSQVRVIRISHLSEEAVKRSVTYVSASIGEAIRAAVVADSPFAEAVRLRDTRLSGAEAKGVYLYCVDLDLHRQIQDFLADLGVAIVTRDERQRRPGTPALMCDLQSLAAAAVVVMHRDVAGLPLPDTDYVLGAAQAAFGMDRVIAMLEQGAGWSGHLAGHWYGFRRNRLDLSSLRLRLLELGLVK